MALTPEEQELLDFALTALPTWFSEANRPAEFMGGAAKVGGAAQTQGSFWFSQARILQAVGPVLENNASLRLAAGSGQWVEISDGSQTGLDLTTFTIEAWIKLDALAMARTIVAKTDTAPQSNLSYIFGLEVNDQLVLAISPDGTAGSADLATSAVNAITDTDWHHVAVTYDSSSGVAFFYVDGVRQAPGFVVSGAPTPFNGAADFSIGNIEDGSGADFEGYIDQVRIWSVVRTPAEIAANLRTVLDPTAVTGLVAAWRFEQDLSDSSGNGNTLVGQGGGPSFTEGVPFANTVEPDWLQQHARDRGTARQLGETDAALRERLRNVPDAVTRPSLLTAAQAIVDAAGVVGTVALVELRRDKGFFRTAASDAGTDGTFTGVAPDLRFEPLAGFAAPPFRAIEEEVEHRIVFSGASLAGNDGTFTITGLAEDAAAYTNASGAAAVDTSLTWTVQKHDRDGNLLDGFQDSFLSRGDRMGDDRAAIVVILPFGCTESTRQSVLEEIRQRKGAGVQVFVECRLNP